MDPVSVDFGEENSLLAQLKRDHPGAVVPDSFRPYHFSLSEDLVFNSGSRHWHLAANPVVDLGPKLPQWAVTRCGANAILDSLRDEGVDPFYARGQYEKLVAASCTDWEAYNKDNSRHWRYDPVNSQVLSAVAEIQQVSVVKALHQIFNLENEDNNRNSFSSGGVMAGSLCDASYRFGLLREALARRADELSVPPSSPLAEADFHGPREG